MIRFRILISLLVSTVTQPSAAALLFAPVTANLSAHVLIVRDGDMDGTPLTFAQCTNFRTGPLLRHVNPSRVTNMTSRPVQYLRGTGTMPLHCT